MELYKTKLHPELVSRRISGIILTPMPRKRKKVRRTERLTLSLSSKEKSFIKAFRRKFNEKLETKFSYGEIFLLLCDDEATKQKVRPVLKQLSLFESCADENCAEL